MIAVIDYDVGNVRSVCNAFRYIGFDAVLSSDPAVIERAAGVVLPGVAAFGYAVAALGSLKDVVRRLALGGKPLLGICVGFQLLFDESCEYGRHEGLGLIGGKVAAIPPGRVIPHMGWNLVEMPDNMDLFAGLGDAKHFYFAHSYHAQVAGDAAAALAYTEYGFEMVAAVQKGNVFGTQFHPEKSGPQGLKVLANFVEVCAKGGRTC
ncbi:MAG TPA: imidazole glycerol phosphate synthase subunit HisH [Phycisphaerales bacterium]|nr:imidazole glycerol phosphate synthase subunit HisH [Phycisphaerales bacterium]